MNLQPDANACSFGVLTAAFQGVSYLFQGLLHRDAVVYLQAIGADLDAAGTDVDRQVHEQVRCLDVGVDLSGVRRVVLASGTQADLC